MKKYLWIVALLVTGRAWAAGEFYVYEDKGSKLNHYIPSGWMGDVKDISYQDAVKDNCKAGTCIKLVYTPRGDQGWAGVYWQHPANNWGASAGGYDLSAYKKLTFWARADKSAVLDTVKMGGITGEHGDTDAVEMGPVEVTTKWQKFTLDLDSRNLAHIVGGFCWSASQSSNPDGFAVYLDEIRYER